LTQNRLGKAIVLFGAAILFVIAIFPFYWMVTASMKPFAEIFMRPSFFPRTLVWSNYKELFETTSIVIHLWNSLWTSLVTTGLTLALATMTGYTITRWQSVSGELVARLTLFSYMAPSIVLILPLYLILKSVQLTNTYVGLIGSYLTFTLPFAIWIMRSHFQAIPQTMEDAALIDGATRFQAFFRVVIPQAVPGIIATGIFVFIMCWGEYLYPLVLMATDNRKTIALTLASLSGGGQNIKFGLLMAGSTVATLPIMVLFLFVQKYLIQGFAAGGVD
jgi:multiple sugar transport system permease protein